MGRRTHYGEKAFAGQTPFQSAKLFGRDHDDFITAVHRDELWTFCAHTANKFAETRLRVLQSPMVQPPIAPAAAQFWLQWLRFS
jgi:hypothetical protein